MALTNVLHVMLLCTLTQRISFRTVDVVFAQDRADILKDPNIYYITTELICSEGYPAQEHTIITEDGYVLTVHRIPNANRKHKVLRSGDHYRKIHLTHHPDFDACIKESLNETATGLPVVFVHGLLMASDGWLLQGPKYDLAYILADQGYDVWLVNIRGNFYSRKHLSLSPSDAKFWDYSFHENGVYDLPATIDYILRLTKKEKIGYVGMSMGTTIFFTMASMRPEYNDKILASVMLAPVAYMKYSNTDTRRRMVFDVFLRLINEIKERSNVSELFPRSQQLLEIGKTYCSKGSQFQDFCYDLITLICGKHSKLVLRNKLHLYVTHLPTGTSLKTFLHYSQSIKGNQFKLFDYGPDKNFRIYGSSEPPDYPVWNITAPVALYYTVGDVYYSAKDVELLRELLPNVVDVDESHKFNHADYLWSYKAKDVIYPRALKVFEKFKSQLYVRSRNDNSKNS